MQRLISIRISEGKEIPKVEEHLAQDLSAGWRVKHFTIAAAGSTFDAGNIGKYQEARNVAWLAVLLERDGA